MTLDASLKASAYSMVFLQGLNEIMLVRPLTQGLAHGNKGELLLLLLRLLLHPPHLSSGRQEGGGLRPVPVFGLQDTLGQAGAAAQWLWPLEFC